MTEYRYQVPEWPNPCAHTQSGEHAWRLARTTQQSGYRREVRDGEGRNWWGGRRRLITELPQYQRIDEYYCERCLQEVRIERRSEGRFPDWWANGVESLASSFTSIF